MGPERPDLWSQRPNLRPEGPDGGTNGRTDRRMNGSPPVFYRTSSPSGPLPKNRVIIKSTRVLVIYFVGHVFNNMVNLITSPNAFYLLALDSISVDSYPPFTLHISAVLPNIYSFSSPCSLDIPQGFVGCEGFGVGSGGSPHRSISLP